MSDYTDVILQVEAMNDVGATMKALGRNEQAYEWWWKAIQTRPTYWDATVCTSLPVASLVSLRALLG